MKKLTQYFHKLRSGSSLEEPKNEIKHPPEINNWQETEHLQYLMQTVKLKYKTKTGAKVTLEDMTPEQVINHISDVTQNPEHPMSQNIDNQGTPCPIEISVCAISLEKSENQYRVRAIPGAACLRLINLNTPSMDVYYEHENPNRVSRDDACSSPLSPINGSKTYKTDFLHPSAFFEKLKQVNDNNKILLDTNSGIRAENFEEIFSEHELEALNNLS